MRLNTQGTTVLSRSEITSPPNREVEVKEVGRTADPNRNDLDSGHLYGFMIAFLSKDGEFHFEKASNFIDSLLNFDFNNYEQGPTEYFFSMPPQGINVAEPTTTIVQPTMGRSYVTETQGILLRDLSIAGTTGFRPGVGAKARVAVIHPETLDERGIPKDERTGYFNFIQLRNLFRYYAFLVSNPDYVVGTMGARDHNVTLLWINFHEGEFWECEPTSFLTRRDASRPMMFNYEIACKLLRKFDSISFRAPDWLPGAWFINDTLDTINDYINQAVNVVEFVSSVGRQLSDIGRTVYDRFAGTYSNLIRLLTVGSVATYTAYDALKNLPENILTEARDAAKDLTDQFESYLETIDDLDENYYESYVNASWGFIAYKIANRLYCHKRDGQTSQKPPRRLDYHPNSEYYPDFNFREPQEPISGKGAFVVDRVLAGETIKDVAYRTLGNDNRWEDLVALNNLIEPYVSNYPDEGVLGYGDQILIPVNSNDPRLDENAVFPTDSKAFQATVKDVDLAKALYGTDIKAKFAGYGGGGNPLVDICVENGDIQLTSGSDNFVQAMELKANTEKGGLKLHPWYGRMILVGLKSELAVITMTAISFRQCILADPRVMDLESLSVSVSGDTLTTKMSIIGQKTLAKAPIVTRMNI